MKLTQCSKSTSVKKITNKRKQTGFPDDPMAKNLPMQGTLGRCPQATGSNEACVP